VGMTKTGVTAGVVDRTADMAVVVVAVAARKEDTEVATTPIGRTEDTGTMRTAAPIPATILPIRIPAAAMRLLSSLRRTLITVPPTAPVPHQRTLALAPTAPRSASIPQS